MMRKVLILILSLLGNSVSAGTLNQAIINPEYPRDVHGFRLSGIPNGPRISGPVKKITEGKDVWYYDRKGRLIKHVRDPGTQFTDTWTWRYDDDDSIRPSWSSREGEISYDSHGNPDYILNTNGYQFSSGPGNSVIIHVKGGNGIPGQRWTYKNGHIIEEWNGSVSNQAPETRIQYEFDDKNDVLIIKKRTFENDKLVHVKESLYEKKSTADWVELIRRETVWGQTDKINFNSFVRKYTVDKYGNWTKYKQCFPKVVDKSIDWGELGDKKCRTVTRKIEYY